MKILCTESFGDPARWNENTRLVAEAALLEAEWSWRESILTADLRHTTGIDIAGASLLSACPAMGYPFCAAILDLLKKGVLVADVLLEWDTLILTREFIEAQQKAHKVLRDRTNRLADLCLITHEKMMDSLHRSVNKRSDIDRILNRPGETYLLQNQYNRLMKLAKVWHQSGKLDNALWGERITLGVESLAHTEYAS